jgi:protein involved in polysaccharide export with SLBB domain
MRFKTFRISVLSAVIMAAAFCTSTQPASAQTASPAILQMAQGELQKRGLNEAEVRARLMQEGINVDYVNPAEMPAYQARITSILDKMEAEKRSKATSVNPKIVSDTDYILGKTPVPDSYLIRDESSPDKKNEVVKSDFKKKELNTKSQNDSTMIYGHSLFKDHSFDLYNSTDGSQAPETYVLGDGDVIHITIFGASQTDIQQKISVDGSIQPTGAAKIFLKGLTLAQARKVISERLSSAYLFRPDQLAVTIIKARTILVNVFGEVNVSGGITLSALNSALNALSAAGGPSDIGTVRNIEIIRGNSRKIIDLYDFMSDPSVNSRFDLQNNDIIYVPVAKKIVSIEGAVKRPMMYEMTASETLTDLIKYSGGLATNAYPDYLQIQRFVDGEELLQEYNLKEVLTSRVKVPLINGDKVRLRSIAKPLEEYVEIQGSVYYPGKFDLSSNKRLGSLIANAKPTFQAKTDFLFIERTRPDSTIELLTVPFPNEQTEQTDFILLARDKVRILNQSEYRDIDTISVSGFVRNPFTKKFGLNDRLTVKQAIEFAGGLKTSVYPVAYIFRKNLFNPKEVKYIRIDLEKDQNIQLQPGDQLNVYDNTTYTNVGEVGIYGAVKNPKGYTYDPTMTLRDLITNSGGFTIGAAFNKVQVYRTIISPTEKVRVELYSVEVDSSYNPVFPADFALQPYDKIVVRMTPEFSLGRVVEINGQVHYPGPYALDSKQVKLSDLIKRAGGLLEDADPYGTQLFRTYNNRGFISLNLHRAMNNIGDVKDDPILFEGDVINISRLENVVVIKSTGTRMDQYTLLTDTMSFKDMVDQKEYKNVIYHGQHSAGWYIKNFAGGFQKNADRNSVTITLPNNQTVATKHFLGFIRVYPTVKAGSTITMVMSKEKMEAEAKPKEKVDWEGIAARGLSTLMSTLSIIMLVQQLAKSN